VGSGLPPGAAAAIERYLDAVDAAVPGLVVGLHACGSLALGDYQGERSDIDVVVIVSSTPDREQRPLLSEIHRVVATRVDGPYLTADALAGAPNAVGAVPYHVAGRFEFGNCYEVSPITWSILVNQAITVRGDAPVALGCKADDDAVREFSAANLTTYWANWAQQFAGLIAATSDDDASEADLVQWGVLGAPRVHCGANTGRVISRTAAGDYARATFGPEWHDLIDLALASRAGTIREARVGDLRRATDLVLSIT
jgi:hypothetical protein